MKIFKNKESDFDRTTNPPKLEAHLKKSITEIVFLSTALVSSVLFVIMFLLVSRIVQNQQFVRIIELERNWANAVESFGKLLNVLSKQTEIFENEECVVNLLQQIYEHYHPLVAYPAFGRSDGKMFTYPKYDYGPDYDPRKRPWYQAAVQNPESYVLVKPFIHAILKEPAIALAKAVYDEEKNLLGVLGLDLIASRVADALLIDRSYIVDEMGQILAKKGTLKTFSHLNFVGLEKIASGRVGLTNYVAKFSIAGTYVVVEDSLLDEILISLIAPLSVVSSVFIVNLFAVRRLRKALKKTVVQPMENIVEAVRNYLSGRGFEIEEIEEPTYETKMLASELSDMVTIIDSQTQELKASYDQLEASQREIEEAYERLRLEEEEIRYAYNLLSEKLSAVIENFDEPTGEHVQRVKKLSKFLAEKLNLPRELVEQIELYAPLHDIGKIKVPKEILNKPGRLTYEEFEIVKKHVLWGAEMVGDDEKLKVARNIVLYHHERYDGSGYPFGLKDGEIPIEAQIVGLVDVYDALRSDRPYKKALNHEEALRIIVEGDEKTLPRQFSPELLEIFSKYSDEIRRLWEEL
uniref:HD-GYP domain-containing protein n=1 Tax=Pseudothermotoga hypogea TaxID=57487 RepID=A0A832MP38_9THEM